MVKSIVAVVSVLAFLAATLLVSAPAKAAQPGSGIAGIVFVATDDGRRPVGDAHVVLKTPDGHVVARTTTGDRGHFGFRHVRPGHYIVEAAKRGVGHGAVRVAVEGDEVERVRIQLQQ